MEPGVPPILTGQTGGATAGASNTPAGQIPDATVIDARPTSRAGDASPVCVSVGPFPSVAHADLVEAWLAPRSTALYRITRVIRKKQFFWVYLEPKNAAEIDAHVAELKKRGFHDYLLIDRGGMKKAISLGLFSSPEAVSRRLEEVREEGMQPLVVPRTESTEYQWIRANLAVEFTNLGQIPIEKLAGAAVLPVECARITQPATDP